MNTNSFLYEEESENFCKDTAVETSEYSKDGNRRLSIRKNKTVISMMIDKLNRKIKTEFAPLRAKIYAHIKLDKRDKYFIIEKDKICKGTKKCFVAKLLTFKNYKKSL